MNNVRRFLWSNQRRPDKVRNYFLMEFRRVLNTKLPGYFSRRFLLAFLLVSIFGCGGRGTETSQEGGGSPGGGGENSAFLSWTPPATNMDGSSLVDLVGYKIRFGTQSGVYTQVIDIKDPATYTYKIENLPPDTYYFVLTAYDATGYESSFSNEVSKTIH